MVFLMLINSGILALYSHDYDLIRFYY